MLKKTLIIVLMLFSFGIANADTPNKVIDNSDVEKENAKILRDSDCKISGNCIDKSSFTISVNDISPGMDIDSSKSTTENVNMALGTIIQTLMIALGSLSLLIMTVGAGYIVMHHGQDELLSKGKAIFLSGVYAMVVALSSYYLISIIRYILYT